MSRIAQDMWRSSRRENGRIAGYVAILTPQKTGAGTSEMGYSLIEIALAILIFYTGVTLVIYYDL